MKHFLLPQEGQFYKANLHCHTTLSDGSLTPEEVKEAYQAKGYSIVAFTDHRVLVPHLELKDEGFLPITSLEIDVMDQRRKGQDRDCYHFNFFSKNELADLFPPREEILEDYSVATINRYIAKANELGFLAQYNHPRWSGQDVRHFSPLEGLWGFEVFNSGTHSVKRDGWGDEEFQQMCREGKYLCATAGDDNHNHLPMDHFDSECFRGWTMIKAPALTYDAVLTAMEKGDLYASTGPEIYELYVEDGKVHIKTSPANLIILRGQYRDNLRSSAPTDSLTEAVFDLRELPRVAPFFRIEVRDRKGNALTRAYAQEEWINR